MRLLVDTHAFLWWNSGDPRFSHAARAALSDARNDLFLSVASAWEAALKVRVGKLAVRPDLATAIRLFMGRLPATALAVSPEHAIGVEAVPQPHRDPFDLLLIAQARLEGLTVVTADPVFARYGVPVIW